jgi:hypothetical protein
MEGLLIWLLVPSFNICVCVMRCVVFRLAPSLAFGPRSSHACLPTFLICSHPPHIQQIPPAKDEGQSPHGRDQTLGNTVKATESAYNDNNTEDDTYLAMNRTHNAPGPTHGRRQPFGRGYMTKKKAKKPASARCPQSDTCLATRDFYSICNTPYLLLLSSNLALSKPPSTQSQLLTLTSWHQAAHLKIFSR